MNDFRRPGGFEDSWRNPGSRPRFEAKNQLGLRGQISASRLARIARHAPEVVVRVTSGLKSGRAVARHLDYISRKGDLELEGPEGRTVQGREEVAELAREWTWVAETDTEKAANGPIARAIVLSIPTGPQIEKVEAAARDFADRTFGSRFEYVFVRHEDGAHPHVHMTVRALGADGGRLTPRREDLQIWRERFAEALRDHGVEAEATSRHTRGVIVRPERVGVMRMRQRHERGEGPAPTATVRAKQEAVQYIREGRQDAAWEAELRARARATKRIYESMGRMLAGSDDPNDRALAIEVAAFAAQMPDPQSRRQKMAQEMERKTKAPAVAERTADRSQASDLGLERVRARVRNRERDRGHER